MTVCKYFLLNEWLTLVYLNKIIAIESCMHKIDLGSLSHFSIILHVLLMVEKEGLSGSSCSYFLLRCSIKFDSITTGYESVTYSLR